MDDISTRVSRGEKKLDIYDKRSRKKTQWFERIATVDFHKFNMAVDQYCLLGRWFGGFIPGLSSVRVDIKEATYYGFSCAHLPEYPFLTEVWRMRIYARLIEKIDALIVPLRCHVTGSIPFSVGNHGDKRVYQPGVLVRFPKDMSTKERGEIATRIINEVKGVTRVMSEL